MTDESTYLDRAADLAQVVGLDEPRIKIFPHALLEYHLEPSGVLKMKFFPKESPTRVGHALRDVFGNGNAERVEWVAETRAFFVWARNMNPFLVHGLLTGLQKVL